MPIQHCVLGCVLAMAASTAMAQSGGGMLRWRSGAESLGLQAGKDVQLPCSSYTLSCSNASSVALYASETAPRTLSMQVTEAERPAALHLGRSPGLNVSLVGKAGIVQDLGVYGRVGTAVNRTSSATRLMGAPDAGLTYGVGLSWDLSRKASAAFGLDAYDVRAVGGDVRDWRTSLGLQWRY